MNPVTLRSLCRPVSSVVTRASRAGILSAALVAGVFVSTPGVYAVTPMVVSGHNTVFMLRSDGSVFATGDNSSGQFGNGTTLSSSTPVLVATGMIAVSSGYAHTLFLKSDGTVVAAGKNDFGQLGDGTMIDRTTPVPVQGLTGITAIAAGGNMSLYLKSDNTAWSTGFTADTTAPTRSVAARIATHVTGVAAGGGDSIEFLYPSQFPTAGPINNGHGLLLRDDTSVYGFGDNGFGQLGDNASSPTSRATLAAVTDTTGTASLIGVKAIAAGSDHSVFLKTDGTVLAAGANIYGQVGIADAGSTAASTGGNWYFYIRPAQVLTGVSAIGAGEHYSLYVKTTGATAFSAGLNSSGQLGDGTLVNRFSPKQIGTGMLSMAGGYGHTVFLQTNSDILTSGDNTFGQLGDTSGSSRMTAVKIGSMTAKAQTITFVSPGNQTMATPVIALTGTSDSLLPLTYTVTSGPATVDGSTLTLTGEGSVTIKATQPGSFIYGAATAVTRTFSVTKGAQTLTFAPPATISLSNSPLTLAGTSSSGLAVTYSVVSGPATIDGSVLTLTGTGPVVVRASQVGNAAFLAATSVDATVTVTPREGMDAWTTAAGLTGSDALPTAIPFHDGVTNLLKFAFNMNGAAPDVSVLTATGTKGLPLVILDKSGTDPVLRVTFLRRKGSTLVYTAQRSADLSAYTAMVGTPTVTSIDSDWERVSVEETVSLSTAPLGFARVQVDMP